MVLIIPVGYTQMFSFLENQTLIIPIATAINSTGPVPLMPLTNCSKTSARLKFGFLGKDSG